MAKRCHRRPSRLLGPSGAWGPWSKLRWGKLHRKIPSWLVYVSLGYQRFLILTTTSKLGSELVQDSLRRVLKMGGSSPGKKGSAIPILVPRRFSAPMGQDFSTISRHKGVSHRIHGAGILMLTWMGYIDGIHVTIYSSTMDPMGMAILPITFFCFAIKHILIRQRLRTNREGRKSSPQCLVWFGSDVRR
jgi:hypothetical protein